MNYDSFRNFAGPRPGGHVLVRLDKSLPFKPGNVRWGTHSENSKSRGPMKKFSCARDEELIKDVDTQLKPRDLDPILDDVPEYIWHAARIISDWAMVNGHKGWVIGPVADANLLRKEEYR